MVAWPVRLAETGTGVLRRRVVEAAFHGGDDGVVARAAAEVPGVPSADFLAGNGLAFVFFDEGRTAHDEAGRAEAALDGPGVHIGLLDAGKPVALGFALGGADRFAVRPDSKEKYRNPQGYCRRARCTRRIRPRRSLVWSWSGLRRAGLRAARRGRQRKVPVPCR